MKRGEVYWVRFGPSVGGEIQKERPAVVVSNDFANHRLNRVQVVPLTTNTAKIYPGEALITIGGKSAKAVADQITTVSKERVSNFLGELSNEEMERIGEAIILQLGL